MAESITVRLIGREDIEIGYGTYSTTLLNGSSVTPQRLNLSHLYAPYTVTYSATPVFSLQNGIVQTITLTGNVTSSTITNGASSIPTGAHLVLRIVQDGTGSRTFVFPVALTNGTALTIASAASAETRLELEYNGTTWEFCGINGTGTASYVPKFTAQNVIGNSAFYDGGSGDGRFAVAQNAATTLWVVNNTDGSASSSILKVGDNTSSADNVFIELISQKNSNTTNSWNLSGVVRTGSGATSGMILSSAAGPIRFQPAGTTTKMALFLSTTGASSQYNLEIGTTAATAADANPLWVARSQNASTDAIVTNANNSGTSSRASWRAVSGSGADIYMGVTSNSYTTSGGVTNNQGFFYTGSSTTNGIVIQTAAGNLNFQIAGTTSNGVMTTNEMRMTGRFRAIGMNRVSPTSAMSADLYLDTTAAANVGALVAATWGANEGATTMLGFNYSAGLHEFFTGGTFSTVATALRIDAGVSVGGPTGGDKGSGTLNLKGNMYHQGTQVVAARQTGWTAWTGTPSRATRDTATVTTAQVAGAFMALLADLTTHGLVG